MYTAIIKATKPVSVQLAATNASAPAKAQYIPANSDLKNIIEASYGPFGHSLSDTYSVEELEFVLKSLKIKFTVLKDVPRNEFYSSVINPDTYT